MGYVLVESLPLPWVRVGGSLGLRGGLRAFCARALGPQQELVDDLRMQRLVFPEVGVDVRHILEDVEDAHSSHSRSGHRKSHCFARWHRCALGARGVLLLGRWCGLRGWHRHHALCYDKRRALEASWLLLRLLWVQLLAAGL